MDQQQSHHGSSALVSSSSSQQCPYKAQEEWGLLSGSSSGFSNEPTPTWNGLGGVVAVAEDKEFGHCLDDPASDDSDSQQQPQQQQPNDQQKVIKKRRKQPNTFGTPQISFHFEKGGGALRKTKAAEPTSTSTLSKHHHSSADEATTTSRLRNLSLARSNGTRHQKSSVAKVGAAPPPMTRHTEDKPHPLPMQQRAAALQETEETGYMSKTSSTDSLSCDSLPSRPQRRLSRRSFTDDLGDADVHIADVHADVHIADADKSRTLQVQGSSNHNPHGYEDPNAQPAQDNQNNPYGYGDPEPQPAQDNQNPYGYGDPEPQTANPYGYGDPEPQTANPYGYGDPEPQTANPYGYGDPEPQTAPPSNPYGYGDPEPQTAPDSNPYGYGDPEPQTAPPSNPYGYGDPEPQPARPSRGRRQYSRRGSVTKFSIQASIEVAQKFDAPEETTTYKSMTPSQNGSGEPFFPFSSHRGSKINSSSTTIELPSCNSVQSLQGIMMKNSSQRYSNARRSGSMGALRVNPSLPHAGPEALHAPWAPSPHFSPATRSKSLRSVLDTALSETGSMQDIRSTTTERESVDVDVGNLHVLLDESLDASLSNIPS